MLRFVKVKQITTFHKVCLTYASVKNLKLKDFQQSNIKHLMKWSELGLLSYTLVLQISVDSFMLSKLDSSVAVATDWLSFHAR